MTREEQNCKFLYELGLSVVSVEQARNATRIILSRCIPRYKRTIVLMVLDKIPIKKIAAQLGTSVEVVKKSYDEAMQEIYDWLRFVLSYDEEEL